MRANPDDDLGAPSPTSTMHGKGLLSRLRLRRRKNGGAQSSHSHDTASVGTIERDVRTPDLSRIAMGDRPGGNRLQGARTYSRAQFLALVSAFRASGACLAGSRQLGLCAPYLVHGETGGLRT